MGFLGVLYVAVLVYASTGNAQEDVYNARCHLKVEGNEITWINWQAALTFIPVGTQLRVTRAGSKATLVNPETKATYTLDIGADGQDFLEKCATKTLPGIAAFPTDVQTDIRNTMAKAGMTKGIGVAFDPATGKVNRAEGI